MGVWVVAREWLWCCYGSVGGCQGVYMRLPDYFYLIDTVYGIVV